MSIIATRYLLGWCMGAIAGILWTQYWNIKGVSRYKERNQMVLVKLEGEE